MLNKINALFKSLLVSIQMAKLYGHDHPKLKTAIDNTFDSLQKIFVDKEELAIGIVADEIAVEKEIFFEASKLMKPIIDYLKERKVEKVVFNRKMDKDDLKKFIVFLTSPKDTLKRDAQEILVSMGVKNISAGHLLAPDITKADPVRPETGATLTRDLSYIKLYQDSLNQFSNTVNTILDGKSIDYFNLKISVNNMFEKLTTQYQDLLKLTSVKKYDLGTFVHILNVSILSMYFSYKLGFAKEDVLDIGIAGLFHDIGKIYISRKIINKPDRLTDDEFSKMKSHTTLGAVMLLKQINTFGMLPFVVAFEHHLKYDVSGYPKISIKTKPHPISLIVSICDVYDALTQKRSYKNDYPPKKIYEIMTSDKGTAFDPELLDKFFKTMGVWPIGTIVQLTDSRIAIVREENESDIFNPIVEIIEPKDSGKLLNLAQTKETLQISHYLNPFLEGKQYVDFV